MCGIIGVSNHEEAANIAFLGLLFLLLGVQCGNLYTLDYVLLYIQCHRAINAIDLLPVSGLFRQYLSVKCVCTEYQLRFF